MPSLKEVILAPTGVRGLGREASAVTAQTLLSVSRGRLCCRLQGQQREAGGGECEAHYSEGLGLTPRVEDENHSVD